VEIDLAAWAELFGLIAPFPSHCTGTEIFPGISPAELAAAYGFQGPKLTASTDVEFVLFVLSSALGSEICNKMEQSVEEVMSDYAPARFRRIYSSDNTTYSQFRTGSYPTLVIVHAGSAVRQINGYRSAADIRKELADVFAL
tara:strand:- start:340 stop:765 length:426 start_codon:yes stop_codon:yes gene_type:complete